VNRKRGDYCRVHGGSIEEAISGKKKSSLTIWLFPFYFPASSFCRYHKKNQLLIILCNIEIMKHIYSTQKRI
jgi:hypothetical protein